MTRYAYVLHNGALIDPSGESEAPAVSAERIDGDVESITWVHRFEEVPALVATSTSADEWAHLYDLEVVDPELAVLVRAERRR